MAGTGASSSSIISVFPLVVLIVHCYLSGRQWGFVVLNYFGTPTPSCERSSRDHNAVAWGDVLEACGHRSSGRNRSFHWQWVILCHNRSYRQISTIAASVPLLGSYSAQCGQLVLIGAAPAILGEIFHHCLSEPRLLLTLAIVWCYYCCVGDDEDGTQGSDLDLHFLCILHNWYWVCGKSVLNLTHNKIPGWLFSSA